MEKFIDMSKKVINKIKQIVKWDSLDLFFKIALISSIIMIFSFLFEKIRGNNLGAFLAVMEIAALIVAVLMHKDIIKVKVKWVQYVVLSFSILFIAVNGLCYSKENVEEEVIETAEQTEVVVPQNSEEYVGEEYTDVKRKFSALGFSSIKCTKIEDLKLAESDKLETVETVTINGESFNKNDTFDKYDEVEIKYHVYEKIKVNIHVKFISNIFFNKYDVKFTMNGTNSNILKHGNDSDFELEVDPGEYVLKFESTEDENVNGSTKLYVDGRINCEYSIYCHGNRIDVTEEYVEKIDDVGEGDIMMPNDKSNYLHKNYKEVEAELKELGFSDFSTEILYDIVFGITSEGETAKVSIGGNDEFNRGDIFKANDKVVITYHMKEENDPVRIEQRKAEEEKRAEEERLATEAKKHEEEKEAENDKNAAYDKINATAMPIMAGTSVEEIVNIAKEFNIEEVYEEDFGQGTLNKEMSNPSGGLMLSLIYNKSTNEILCATITTLKSEKAEIQEKLIEEMAPVLCPKDDSQAVSEWANSNVGKKSEKEINGFNYELSLGSDNNCVYNAGVSNWEEWTLSVDNVDSEQNKENAASAEELSPEEVGKVLEKIDAQKERSNWIGSQFSIWDGNHKVLTKLIKKNLNDEKSFKFIDANYIDIKDEDTKNTVNAELKKLKVKERVEVGDLFVYEDFSAKNAFNATIKMTGYGISRSNGDVILLAIE